MVVGKKDKIENTETVAFVKVPLANQWLHTGFEGNGGELHPVCVNDFGYTPALFLGKVCAQCMSCC